MLARRILLSLLVIVATAVNPASASDENIQESGSGLKFTEVASFNHGQTVSLSWSGDGRFLSSSGLGALTNIFGWSPVKPTVAVWDVQNKKLLADHFRPGGYTTAVLIGDLPIVLGYFQNSKGWSPQVAFSLWDARTGEPLKHILSEAVPENRRSDPVANNLTSYSYNYKKDLFAYSYGSMPIIQIVETKTWKSVSTIKAKQHPLKFALSPDGTRIAVSHRPNSIEIWDIQFSRLIKSFHAFEDGAHDFVWSHDGDMIAAIETGFDKPPKAAPDPVNDYRIKIFMAETGEMRLGFKSVRGARLSSGSTISWSHDGRFLATVLSDGAVVVWSLSDPNAFVSLPVGNRGAKVASFSPKSGLLAVAADRDVKIFDVIQARP